ncbi:fatty-acyl-CoA synthase [Allopseudospirillum japonicum]|uniref:Fatty-acyl-CoA synthase n=1 Tax=Allopseudospirillum japonicum TaxID=64971 RepID=A0A1H6TW52_9GAMM|nr:fatty acyl-CoA synthetase [Allopseudospirillum japonicum]SEI84273.1 fatty-acyl-CoA synthase [Allopseudospirillum japonicum]
MFTPDIIKTIARANTNTINQALSRRVARHPNKTALIYKQRHWSFAQLEQGIDRVAQGLHEQGLRKGDRVAAYGKNSDAYLLLWLACAKLGLIHVPVNFALVKEELLYILHQSGAKALFSDPSLQVHIEAIDQEMSLNLHGSLQEGNTQLDILSLAMRDKVIQLPEVAIQETDVVQILYTSGTTSDPKGAMHTHRSLMAEYLSCMQHLDIDMQERALAALPLYHSAQMHVFTMPTLLAGGLTYLIDTPTADNILDKLKTHQLTSFFAPPTLWIALLRHPAFVDQDLKGLQKIYYGASIMPESVVHELEERLPQAGLYNCYGQSEIAPLASVLRPEEHKQRPTSCGQPLASVWSRIIDPVTGEDCAFGQQGELVHQSPQLMVGYWNKPKETAEAFKDGWFHSGDLAVQDEQGYLYIVDRIKDVVNTGGILVASRDVEEVFYRHPDIAEVAVIGVPDEKWIEAIAAVVVLKPEANTHAQALLAYAGEHLAKFKVPKQIHFVAHLPKNTAGKLLKRQLRDMFS